MAKPEGLFFIREIAATCGVSINALRFYEAKGLLSPAHIDPASGYRYYSRENLHRLRSMLMLKDAGLTLPQIKEHMDGRMDVGEKIAALERKREALDRVIESLKMRSPEGALAVDVIRLPERLCLCRTIEAKDGESALFAISEFYSDIVRRGVTISRAWPEFCEYPDEGLFRGEFKLTDFTVTACVPVDETNAPPEAVRYPAGRAVAVNYHGSYYNLIDAYDALNAYIAQNGLAPAGYPQEIYVEIDASGTVNLGDASYVTRVIVPVK